MLTFAFSVSRVQAQSVATSSTNATLLVVEAPAFQAALEPLLAERRKQGFNVVVVSTANIFTPEQIKSGNGAPLESFLQNATAKEKIDFVLLAGVAPAAGNSEVAQQTVVPSLAGKIGRMKGKPSDFGFGLPDTNGLPKISVGRFPARSIEEMQGMVSKTLALERDREPGPWRNRLLLIEGNSGSGVLGDMFMDQTTRARIKLLHPAWTLQTVFDNPRSTNYVPTARLHDTAIVALAAGELFSVYMGHSGSAGLWSINTNFLSSTDFARLKIARGGGVLFSCGCFACEPDAPRREAYGLSAMRNPAGPVAVIGASGESYSAPGLLAADGLLRCLGTPPFPSRLGNYWQAIQAGLAAGEIDNATFMMCDQADGTGGKVPLSIQRQEHLEMWMLLGDPTLRLPILSSEVTPEKSSAARQ